jgi:ribosome-associated toxin RatA of RatAB toxin-antitoxin module
MTIEMQGEASAHISAPPEKVYAVVSDVTRMGEWSPECVNVTWADGADGPVVGAQFHGTNKRNDNEWTTPNTILVADEGKEFAWVVGTADFQVTRWRFVFDAENGGTKVTESFELGDQEVGFSSAVMAAPEAERAALVEARRTQLIADMQATLTRLKECVEAT